MGGRLGKGETGQRQPSKSEALLARVVQAGGTLEVSHGDGINYAALVATANLYKVPVGKHLVWVGRHGRHERHPKIRLEDLPAWVNAALEPVPVQAKLADTHPAVTALARGQERFHLVAEGRRPAALRMLQALVAEAERRGYTVTVGAVEQAYRQRAANQQWIHLTITVSGHHFYLGIDDDMDRGQISEAERRRRERAAGPIRVQIINGFEHRASRWWLDADDERIGHNLAQVLQELELRAEDQEERHRERLEFDRQRRLRFEEATVEARAAYMEDYRAQVLVKQVDRWHLAQRIDGYLTALEAANAEIDDDEQITEWIAWARRYRERIGPLNQGLEIPVDHMPDLDRLKPYLPKGFSPYTFLLPE